MHFQKYDKKVRLQKDRLRDTRNETKRKRATNVTVTLLRRDKRNKKLKKHREKKTEEAKYQYNKKEKKRTDNYHYDIKQKIVFVKIKSQKRRELVV